MQGLCGWGSEGALEFGYGEGRRPLWTMRDRDAEAVRKALRKAGRRVSNSVTRPKGATFAQVSGP
ncbi:hypothetical protein FHR32_001127 [Streptosporangium album]|uniref:Uncharacterized protein n=1 Tax=Streptosporangium album TaxID=47479 RepID=A0A7W7W718_9ACTN|nr:hypothetical protein [Streptosporangium album]